MCRSPSPTSLSLTIDSNPTDTNTLSAHLGQHEASFGKAPEVLIADARYGSEENYTLLEQKGTIAFVKYGMFDKKQNENHNNKHPLVQIGFSITRRKIVISARWVSR